jgi:hypothetical protein
MKRLFFFAATAIMISYSQPGATSGYYSYYKPYSYSPLSFYFQKYSAILSRTPSYGAQYFGCPYNRCGYTGASIGGMILGHGLWSF